MQGAGDDGNKSTQGNGAYNATPAKVESNVSVATMSQTGIAKYASEAILDSFFSGGFFAVPGSMFVSFTVDALKNAIFKEQDPNKPILDKLETIDKKIDRINANIDTLLNLSAHNKDAVAILFNTLTSNQFTNMLGKITTVINPIASKYKLFFKLAPNGNLTADSQRTALFQYAATHSTVEAVNNMSSVDKLLADFETNFFATHKGSIIGDFQPTKAQLKARLKMNAGSKDVMEDIKLYNLEIISTRVRIYEHLQMLYNMQLVQLAYYYNGANIQVSLLNKPAQNTGQVGFEAAANLLDTEYKALFARLTTTLNQGLVVFDNKDTYDAINNSVFQSTQPLLGTSFANNINTSVKSNPVSCMVSNLTFRQIAGDAAYSVGLADLKARCFIGHGNIEEHSISFPYSKKGAISSYAYGKIQYNNFQLLGETNGLAHPLTPDEVKMFGEANSGLSKSTVVDRQIKSNHVALFSKGGKMGDGIMGLNVSVRFQGGDIKLIPPASGILKNVGPSQLFLLPSAWRENNTAAHLPYKDRGQLKLLNNYYSEIRYGATAWLDNYTDGSLKGVTSGYYLANYRNHWFTIKVSSGFEDAARMTVPDDVIGIGCVEPSPLCQRLDTYGLRWQDGSQISLTTKVGDPGPTGFGEALITGVK